MCRTATLLLPILFLPALGAPAHAQQNPSLSEAVREGYVEPVDEKRLKKLRRGESIGGLDAYSHFLGEAELRDVSADPHYAAYALAVADDAVYLRVPVFHARTSDQVHAALAAAVARMPVGRVVLDLRGNRGGLLNAAIEVADEFIDAGRLASTSGRQDAANLVFLAQPGGLAAGARLAVLVDGDTASAAELLAGILRQRRGAALLGRASYGKSAVQTQVVLEDGKTLSLTMAHYFFADGTSVGESGLQPDLRIERAVLKRHRPMADGHAAVPVEPDVIVRRALQTMPPA